MLVHVVMVAHTPLLVQNVRRILASVDISPQDLGNCFKGINDAMQNINDTMEQMWKASSPKAYDSFRTFIMGIKGQSMFPEGLVYEGCFDNDSVEKVQQGFAKDKESTTPTREKRFYRGESGANDSIIPTMDNLLQLTERMPINELTGILRDFRSYRPLKHAQFVNYIENRSKELSIRNKSLLLCRIEYVQAMEHVRAFRTRHWSFVKKYILENSNHPVATGGSPILTYLPNQLICVLDTLIEDCNLSLSDQSVRYGEEETNYLKDVGEKARCQKDELEWEVIELRRSRGQ